MFGSIKTGNWDRPGEVETKPGYDGTPAHLYHADLFDETIIHRSIELRFGEETPWENTPIVKEARKLINSDHKRWRGCDSEQAIRHRCREIGNLYHEIAENGYQTQLELIRQGDVRCVGFLDALANEILVDIGRDGELLFANGRHRLSIAKILELDTIPVAVLVRHKKWMEQRDQVYSGNINSNHPDIKAICQQTTPSQ